LQQVENHYLTPRTMSNSVHISPILVILALFIGFAGWRGRGRPNRGASRWVR